MASFSDMSPRRPGPSSRPLGIRPEQPFLNPHSTTPPYTSAEEGPASSSRSRPIMMPRQTYPLVSSSASASPGKWMNPRYLQTPSSLPSTDSPAFSPSQLGSSTSNDPSGFSFYPQSFPSNPYVQPYTVPPESSPLEGTGFNLDFGDSDNDNNNDNDDNDKEEDLEAELSEKYVKPPPRPPNAWIIYRSHMLRAIAEGQHLPGLDAVMAESGMSSGESPSGGTDDAVTGDDDGKGKKKKKSKKPKKGSKEPTAGMLTLGKGKTGRGIPQADVSKLISLMWAREQPEIKKQYERQSELQKIEHQRKYPDYKFQPLRRADKLKLREEREKAKTEARLAKKAEKQQATSESTYGSKLSPGVKRKARARVPPTSPYSAAGMSRTASASVPKEDFGMYPFPFPQENLPSMAPSELPFPEPGASKAQAYRASSAAPMLPLPNVIQSPPPPPPHPPAWSDIPDVPLTYNVPDIGRAYAVPYIFEPIPIAGEELNIDLLKPLDESDADALAALWCAVEEEVDNGDVGNTWDLTSNEAMQAWSELGAYPPQPSHVELSSSIAQQLANDWTTAHMQGGMPEYPPEGIYQPVYDPSLDIIQVPYLDSRLLPNDHQLQTGNRLRGPFLTANQPLSPVEPWATDPSIPFRQALVGSNRMPSLSTSDGGLPISSDTSIPRYVSSSAFPATPLSVETNGWTDRSTSFSAFASQMTPAEDNLLWDDEHEFQPLTMSNSMPMYASGSGPVSSGHSPSTMTGPATPFEPVVALQPFTSGSSSDASSRPGPPRNVRRPRTVGAAFSDQA